MTTDEALEVEESGTLSDVVDNPGDGQADESDTDQSGSDQTEGEEGEEQKPDEASKANRWQKRVNKLTAEKHRLLGQLDALRRQQPQREPEKPAPAATIPQREAYQNEAEYLDAMLDYKLAQREERTRREKIDVSWESQQEQARSKYEDYDEMIEAVNHIRIPTAAVEAMRESDVGAELSYYFATHPEELRQLATMSPTASIRRIGAIEAKLSSQVPTQPKKKSAAPDPITPVQPKAKITKDLSKMSDAEYNAKRREDYKKWRMNHG